MKPTIAIGLVGLAALAGCSSGSGTGVMGTNCVGGSCAHGTTGRIFDPTAGSSPSGGSSGTSGGVASSGSSSSGGSAGVSGGTASGGSTGASGGSGTSGVDDYTCSNIPSFDGDGGGCPGSWFGTRLADLGTCAQIAGATVEAIDSNGVPIVGASATTDATGAFLFCVPDGVLYTPFIQAANYPATYLGQQSGPPPLEWIGLLSSDALGVVTGLLSEDYDPNKGVIAIFFESSTRPTCDDQSGWSVTLQLPDGGAIPDGGFSLRYLATNELPDATLTATTEAGAAVAFNVDPSITSYVSVSVSNADAGACQAQFTQFNETGLIFVAGGSISYIAPHLVAP